MDGVARLLAAAQQHGLVVRAEGERVVVRGPRAAEALAQQVLARKAEVLAYLSAGPPAGCAEKNTLGDTCDTCDTFTRAPRVLPLDQWDDNAAQALVQHTLRRIGWAWNLLAADHQAMLADVQAALLHGLAPIQAARERRAMLELRQALADYERDAAPLFAAAREMR